jgi:hypothetical protein
VHTYGGYQKKDTFMSKPKLDLNRMTGDPWLDWDDAVSPEKPDDLDIAKAYEALERTVTTSGLDIDGHLIAWDAGKRIVWFYLYGESSGGPESHRIVRWTLRISGHREHQRRNWRDHVARLARLSLPGR